MRYQPIRVFHRGPKPVAQILDTKAGRNLYIHRNSSGFYVHWDRMDRPVVEARPRELAREMLLETLLEARA